MRRTATSLLGMLVTAALLAACGTDSGGDPTDARGTSETASSPEFTVDGSATDIPATDPGEP